MWPETLFTICSYGVLPVWLLLIVAPRWRATGWIAGSAVVSFGLAVLYAGIMVATWDDTEGDMTSLSGVQQLFADPRVVLVGWLHYLAFDLFIGTWEVYDSQRLGLAHWRVVPCLLLTLLLGPIGLALYLVQRWALGAWHIGSGVERSAA